MNDNETTKLIVVLGMHRGGTSAITRGLMTLGVSLGDNLLPAQPDNPTGFWEDREIVDLNCRVLATLQMGWDSLRAISDAEFKTPEMDSLKEEAKSLIDKHVSIGRNWAFKDPRTARVLPFWLDVMSSHGLSCYYIIALRNPHSVAMSLKSRDHFTVEAGYMLWALHMLPAMRMLGSAATLVVDYDNFISSPHRELCRLATALHLPQPSSQDSDDLAQTFLDRSLRHFDVSDDDLRQNPRVVGCIADAFFVLKDFARDKTPHKNRLSRCLSDMAAIMPLINFVDGLERRTKAQDAQLLSFSSLLQKCQEDSRMATEAVALLRSEVQKEQQHILQLVQELRVEDVTNAKEIAALRKVQQQNERGLTDLRNDWQADAGGRAHEVTKLRAGLDEHERAIARLHAKAKRSGMRKVRRAIRRLRNTWKRTWRAWRRRRVVFVAVPKNQLSIVSNATGNWQSHGEDPQFALQSKRGGVPTGWVHTKIDIDSDSDLNIAASIYVDRAGGYDEKYRRLLPQPSHGRIDAIVRLPNTVHALRFDPLESSGHFSLGKISMREIGKLEALARLARRSIGHRRKKGRKIKEVLLSAYRLWRTAGYSALKARVINENRTVFGFDNYRTWMDRYDTPTKEERECIAASIERMSYKPKISIIMPVYNTPLSYLREALDSVLAQVYSEWQLCVVDDASTNPKVLEVIRTYVAKDSRVEVSARGTNGGISRASNSALDMVRGEYLCLLDHDDKLHPYALFEVVKLLQEHPEYDMVYTDEDKVDETGLRSGPFFKPDWSPEYFLAMMYTCHLGVYRTDIVKEIGGFRPEYDGAQDYDMVLRFISRTQRIGHVPRVLYHWRAWGESTAQSAENKPYAEVAAQRALQAYLDLNNLKGAVEPGPRRGHHRVRIAIAGEPLVSIVIPTANGSIEYDGKTERLLDECVNGLLFKTTYKKREIVVVHNGNLLDEQERFLERNNVKLIHYKATTFNLATKINLGVQSAEGEYVILLNDDVRPKVEDWVEAMLEFAQLPKVGAVGAKLYFPDGSLQHVGVAILRGNPGHPYYEAPGETEGYGLSAKVVRNWSAVTGACMMSSRDAFDKVGGFDEAFPLNYNDVAFCIRLREAGYRIVYTPYAELYHFEGVSIEGGRSVSAQEPSNFHATWGAKIQEDPYYNRNLSQRVPFSGYASPREPKVLRPPQVAR